MVEFSYYDLYKDSDYPKIKYRHLFIGGPLDGKLLSQDEYFSSKEKGYTRYNSSFKYSKLKAVWLYGEIANKISSDT